jgi:putative membrane protein
MHKLILALTLAIITPVFAADAPKDVTDFANNVAVANKFEIDTSQLALKYGKADDVRKFAQQMLDDHTKAGADFKAALAQANVTPPKDALDLSHTAKYEKLNLFTTEKGFDASYVATQLDAHKDAVKLFQDYVQSASPGPVKDFATKTLPVLQHHLEMVTALNAKYNP